MTGTGIRIRPLRRDDGALLDALVPPSMHVVPDAEGPGVPSTHFAKRIGPIDARDGIGTP